MEKHLLSKEDIEKEGWNQVYTTADTLNGQLAFEKDNFFLCLYYIDGLPCIRIIGKDVIKLTWMGNSPELFRITIPCKTITELRIIFKMLDV